MTGPGPSRPGLILGAFAFTAIAAAGAYVAFDSTRTTLTQWSSPELSVSAGATIALPVVVAFLIALAVATARAIPGHQRPVEKMGRWTWALGAVALVSIPVAGVASDMLSRSLEAGGYRICGRSSSLRLGVAHWRKKDVPCASSCSP